MSAREKIEEKVKQSDFGETLLHFKEDCEDLATLSQKMSRLSDRFQQGQYLEQIAATLSDDDGLQGKLIDIFDRREKFNFDENLFKAFVEKLNGISPPDLHIAEKKIASLEQVLEAYQKKIVRMENCYAELLKMQLLNDGVPLE